ncbi:glycosyltransferase family 2 protein [Actinomyces trachealis]|uniref:glycosyltransferase family 2 protein n=1 Tax=Actinomyces trachealis TaxID=2763540 RepID=UPI0018C5C0E7
MSQAARGQGDTQAGGTKGTTGSVRVVTVAYNPGRELADFLSSLVKATRRKLRIVIADNGQEHALVDKLAELHGAEVVRDGGNHGYGGGANRGAYGLEEDWLVIANPDLAWRPGSLDVLIDAAIAHPEGGCFGPRILSTDGSVYPSGRELPALFKGAGHAVLGRVWPSNPFSKAYHGGNQDQTHAVGWLSGACLLLPAQVWRELGGFDEGYFMFFEDTDLGARVTASGRLNLQVPDAVVIHEQGASWKARPERMIRAHHASARRYFYRSHPAVWQAPARWLVGAGLHMRERSEVKRASRS